MPEAQPKEKTSPVVPTAVNDLILLRLQDLRDDFRDSRKEIIARMDRLETRQDKLETKLETVRQELNDRMDNQDAKIETVRQDLNGRIDKLDAKIDELSKKIDSSMNQGQICLITTIGIAVTVLYSIFSK